MIKLIPDLVVNRIAAGEIIERPASIVKELLENSLDAGATAVTIRVLDAGKSLISVTDNGRGISKDELYLALTAHATSKLDDTYDLHNINTFGFRGEALASIANVSKISIASRTADSTVGYKITAEFGRAGEITHSNLNPGTTVEVSDLFAITPARLKFMKGNKTELSHIRKVIENAALSRIDIDITLVSDDKVILKYKPCKDLAGRFAQILGPESNDNLFSFTEEMGVYSIQSVTSIPNYNRPGTYNVRSFVNARPVYDRFITKSVKEAYSNMIPFNAYPISVVFMRLPNNEVDVNVHPTKNEVRFVHESDVQESVRKVFEKHVMKHANRSSLSLNNIASYYKSPTRPGSQNYTYKSVTPPNVTLNKPSYTLPDCAVYQVNEDIADYSAKAPNDNTQIYLGTPVFQFASRYIISRTEAEIFIIDQHAAHERIIYEGLKDQFFKHGIVIQTLLSPEKVSGIALNTDSVLQNLDYLKTIGMIVEVTPEDDVVISGIPALLEGCSAKDLLLEVISELNEYTQTSSIEDRIKKHLATFACHHSIRSGRSLTQEELAALVRNIEKLENSAQCNHGRPTYCKLSLLDLDKLFDRL